MEKKIQATQCKLIWEQFNLHPYYKLCHSLFEVFQESCPTMVMTPERLFVDAVRTLDILLQANGMSEEICKRLWTNTLNMYNEQDGATYGQPETKCEVAMLFYALMYAFQAINNSEYRCTLSNILHETIWKFYGSDSKPNGCMTIERKLKPKVTQHAEELYEWMDGYFCGAKPLTMEIDTILGKNKKVSNNKKNNSSSKIENPTINYTCTTQEKAKRIDIVMRLLRHWGEIDITQDVNHFQDAFSGNDVKLNVKWKGDSTLLYFMVQQLRKQPFVKKQKTASATAIAKNIFGSTPNANKNRFTDESQQKIDIVIYALNPRNPELILTKNGAVMPDATEGYDDAYIAEQVAKAGGLSITKDLNKNHDW